MSAEDALNYEPLVFDARYNVHTAKNSIESLGHIVAEVGSNEDEAISVRAKRDGTPDEGWIEFAYDPDTEELVVTGNGSGMTAAQMRDRLGRVGAEANAGSRRGFFHRGIREVFLAMGSGRIVSIGRRADGTEVCSEAVFDAYEGMAMVVEDATPTPARRASLGLSGTGTRVQIPMGRFVRSSPGQFSFPRMEAQIRNCVGIRPVLLDPSREVRFTFGDEAPRVLRYTYPDGEDLIQARQVKIAGHPATFWVKIAAQPIKGIRAKQMRQNGILIRGERAAYEVGLGDRIQGYPAMVRVFGELQINAIEQIQRDADVSGDDESQLVYKPDRSGLNPEHPICRAIDKFLDDTVGPLIADLDAGEQRKPVSADMRRQLARLARLINTVVKSEIRVTDDEDAPPSEPPNPVVPSADPPIPPDDVVRTVPAGIGFARGRIFVDAGQSRTVEVWCDVDRIPVGAEIRVTSSKSNVVAAAELGTTTVPEPGKDGVAAVKLTIHAGNVEGRHELVVSAGGLQAVLVVHVRFPRAGGFISNIVPDDRDWEAGSALWNPSSGVVQVFVGRPEFVAAAARAKREGDKDPWKNTVYRTLVVESVREEALWHAAQLHADVEWDQMSHEERSDDNARLNLVRSEFQELDYRLRAKLLQAFGQV